MAGPPSSTRHPGRLLAGIYNMKIRGKEVRERKNGLRSTVDGFGRWKTYFLLKKLEDRE
jgi:hypothetical protein